MSDPLVDRTRRLVAAVFGLPLDQVTSQTSHETVEGWDSLNVLNILMAVESEFAVEISPEEAADFLSVERIVAVLRSKGIG